MTLKSAVDSPIPIAKVRIATIENAIPEEKPHAITDRKQMIAGTSA
jgi:hypothetical protein